MKVLLLTSTLELCGQFTYNSMEAFGTRPLTVGKNGTGWETNPKTID